MQEMSFLGSPMLPSSSEISYMWILHLTNTFIPTISLRQEIWFPPNTSSTLATLRLNWGATAGPLAITVAIESWLTANTADPPGAPDLLCVWEPETWWWPNPVWNGCRQWPALEGVTEKQKAFRYRPRRSPGLIRRDEEANVQEFALLRRGQRWMVQRGFLQLGKRGETEVIDRWVNTPNPNRHSRNC